MPSELDPAFADFQPRRRETPAEAMRRIEIELRGGPDLNRSPVTAGAGRNLEGYNAMIGTQGPLSAGVIGAGDPRTGRPVMAGGRAQAGPVSYQYTQPLFPGAKPSQQVGVGGQPFDADAYFGGSVQQGPGGRTYGLSASGGDDDRRWDVYGGYNPTSRGVNVGGSYTANFAEGGQAKSLRQAIADLQGPEEQGASSPSWEGVGKGLSAVGEGINAIYSTPAIPDNYTAAPEASTRRDVTPRALGERLDPERQGATSPSWEDVGEVLKHMAEDPAALIGGALPVVGNILGAGEVSKLKDKISELRKSGYNAAADRLQKSLPYSAAAAVMPMGGGAAARLAIKGAEKEAAKLIERGATAEAERAALGDLSQLEKQYVTSQEGPYYRVTPATSEGQRPVSGGLRKEAGTIEGADAGGEGRGSYTPPELPSNEDVANLISNLDDNIAHKAAKEHVGRDIERPDMPASSLEKQSAIGRAFMLASEGSPAYKRAVFKAYKEQHPDIVAMSGAKNYDDLLAASYQQMAKETSAQFDALPLEYSFHRNGEGNYANSKEMLADLHGNGHLRVFQGGDRHDFLHNVDPRTGLNENEKFRAVHDAFGHGIFGNPFGAAGEELAWGTHGQMYSPLALPAMTAETRGQNSFVNYSPINAKLKENVAKIESKIATAKQYGWREDIPALEAERAKLYEGWEYAPQKSVLLPPEFLSPNYAGGMPEYIQKLIKPAKGTTMSSPLTHFSNEYGLTQLDPARYGTGIAGDESARLMTPTGEAKSGAVRDRSYYYLGEPSSVNPEAGLGHHVYTTESKKLYDASADPLNLMTLAKESNRSPHLSNFNPGAVNQQKMMNDFERLVKEYGYEGVANPNAAFPMAAVFNPKDVKWQGSTRQTVSNPVRYAYGDVYENPRVLAAEAESRVAPEDPLLKKLFGVTRDDLYQIGSTRKGNMEPQIQTIEGAKVPPTIENIMNDRNKQRLQDALVEFNKQPGLRTGMVPWYVHDPVYQRLAELVGPEEAQQRYKRLNVMTGMMSPGSPVETELNRGYAAHYLNEQKRIEDFYKYGGQGRGGQNPRGADFPPDLETMLSHPYHSTSHATPLRNYIEAGYPDIPGMDSPKVPLYMQASGVPETGFQTKLAVPDAHWTRGMGLPDTRTSKGFNQSMNMREYQHVGPWFREHIAEPLGMESVPAQALMWGGFSGATGVDTLIGAPKIELLAKHIGQVAKRLKVSPETARDLVLLGKAYSHGGAVHGYASGGRAVVGHTSAAGVPVSLEEHKGEVRHRAHSGDSKMAADYGYIDNSKPDADGMKTDAYVGPHKDSKRVFVINQQHPHSGKFNEHKVMLGYHDRAHALRDYAHSFSDGLGHKRIHSVVEMDSHQLKDWLKKDHKQPLKMADGGAVGGAHPLVDKVAEVASEIAGKAKEDNLDPRQLAYLIRVTSGMYIPPDRAMEFANQIMTGDVQGLMQRFMTYKNSIRTFARLDEMLGGKQDLMRKTQMGHRMQRRMGSEALERTADSIDSVFDSDVIKSKPSMAKALKKLKGRL